MNCEEGNTHPSDRLFLILAATVEYIKQWEGTGLRQSHCTASNLFHAVTNATIGGHKIMLLLMFILLYHCY